MSKEQYVSKSIENNNQEMIDQLQQWALINSGTYNKEGLDNIADVISVAFGPLEATFERTPLSPIQHVNNCGVIEELPVGDLLRWRKRPKAAKQILLCGHMDTVFAADDEFQQCQWLDDKRLNGPGVTDMKGGLIVVLHALKILEQQGIDNMGWEVIINPDEEIGSIASAPFLEQAAKYHDIGLIFEPGLGEQGCLASERKGSGKFTIVIEGKAAHAGRAFDKGINAIVALSRVAEQLHQLSGQRPELTVNVGRIIGGGAVNRVPHKAVAWLDVRLAQGDDQAWIIQRFKKILKEIETAMGVVTHLHGQFTRPPKPLNDATLNLLESFREISEEQGVDLHWKKSGGCCDGNNLAAAGLPTIDSLGVRGENIHTDKEFIYIDSLVERAKLLAIFLLRQNQ